MHSQSSCESGEGEKFEYEKLTTLCEQYGGQTPTITITDGFSSDYPAGVWNDEIVQISGEFTINTADFDILNTTIEMGPGAGITVEPGRRLDIDDSFIFSCTEMWRSIEVNLNGDLRIRRSTIEDAQYAIFAASAAVVFVQNSAFQSNWVAAHLSQKPPNPTAVHRFIGNLFAGNTIKPAYPGQSPAPGSESFAGIWADTIPLVQLGNNGPNTITSNRFVSLKNGVISERSNFVIRRTSFESMIDEGVLYSFQSGVGILALENSTINHRGFGKNGLLAFVGCQYASIFSEESTCITTDAFHARLGEFGVRAISPKDHYTEVRNSKFENTNAIISTTNAIYIERSLTNSDKIINNYVYSSAGSAASLITFNNMAAGNSLAEILNNDIEGVSQQILGMEVRPGSGENLIVADNNITAENLFIGLQINSSNSSSSNTLVTRNRIESLQSATQLAKLAQARNVNFCDNILLGNDVAGVGLIINGNSSGTTLGLNQIEETQFGLVFNGAGINMGDQVHKGNTWNGGFGTWAAEHTGFDFLTSRFFVNDDATNCGDPLYFPNDLGVPSVSPNSGWFLNLTNGDCVDDCSQYQSSLALANVYEKTVTGEGLEMGWTPAAHWAAQAYLYQQMTVEGETGLSASLINNFEDQLEHTNIAQVQAYQMRSQEAMGGNAATREAAREQYAAYTEALTAYISYLESLMESEIADPNSAASQQWAENYLAFDAYVAERSTVRNNALEYLIYEMDLVAPNLIEENWLLVNKLLLERERYGDLSAADWATVEELASQCYDKYGSAVYIAQGMLPPCQWETIRERSAQACEGMERPRLPVVKANQVNESIFSIYPNPGNGFLQLQFKEKANTDDFIVVKNIYGQEVLRQPTSFSTIDLAQVGTGVYIIEHRNGDNTLLGTTKYIRL